MTSGTPFAQTRLHMLKKVFPLLLSYVFVTTQCWAISGGPDYGRGSVSTIGTYSGVIAGLTESDISTTGPNIPGDPLPPPSSTSNITSSNALGLFDLGVPQIGTATGAFLVFADGNVFGGTIDASVDPDTAGLRGIVQAAYNFNLTTFNATGDAVTTAVTAQAIGRITAKISATRSSSNVAARIIGTANLDINFGQVDSATLAPVISRTIELSVDGFKQSNTVTATATVGTGTTTGG